MRGLFSRLIFVFIGSGFAMCVFLAIRNGKIRVGRTSSEYIFVGDEPVRFWTLVAVTALMSGIAFYGAFVKRKPDA